MNLSPSPVDPEGLAEYSVVFTDRALNHMSQRFQSVMRDLSAKLKTVYNADALALVPGGGTYAMEAVARQFATDQKVLVVRNGWFSYRWSQIFATGGIVADETVLKAHPVDDEPQSGWVPPAIEAVTAAIERDKPGVVFAAHVETASGMMLPEDYIQAMARATHAVGGLFVLDCIASGAMWIDMAECDVDVLISAPQKGWSSTPSCGLVLLSAAAEKRLAETESSSFALNLAKWRDIVAAYEHGGHAYYATMPTDALVQLHANVCETLAMGLDEARQAQLDLGWKVRDLLARDGFPSVAAGGFEAPGVVVSFTDDNAIHSGQAFAQQGLQVAKGVGLACDEPASFKTFRIGLFGLDKLKNIDATVERLAKALDIIAPVD